jgi:hypothetical protein
MRSLALDWITPHIFYDSAKKANKKTMFPHGMSILSLAT